MTTFISNSLAKKRAMLENNEKGFTLIELLVVVLIIGVLAAIAIPVFLGQQNGAKDSAAKSDLTNAKIAMIAYAAAHDGTYTAVTADLEEFGFVGTEADPVVTLGSAAGVFCITVESGSGTDFAASDDEAPREGTCAATGTITP